MERPVNRRRFAGLLASGVVLAAVCGASGLAVLKAQPRPPQAQQLAPIGDATSLLAALRSARAGDVIRLSPGNYGTLTLQGVSFPGEVVIKSASEASPAIIESLTVRNATGITFSGIELAVKPGVAGVFVKDSANLKFEHMYFHGILDGVPYKDGSGLALRDSRNIIVTKSRFHDLHGGLSHANVQGLEVTDNRMQLLRSDGVIGANSNNILISGNYFSEFYQQPQDHPDCVQFWTTPGSGPTRNIRILNNTFVRGAGGPVQGVFLKDEAGTGYHDVEIRGNAIVGGSYNGIYVTGGTRISVVDNLVAGYEDMGSWIRIQASSDVRVSRNQANALLIGENTNLAQEANVTLKQRKRGDTTILERWQARN